MPPFETVEAELDTHQCDEDADVDVDICTSCGEHAGFCSECGTSSCCGVGAAYMD